MMIKRIPMLLGCALALSVSACDPEPLYEGCPLSSRIQAVCDEQNQGKDDYTCVVREHPWCLEDICASYQDQPSVCTRACESDADCPSSPVAVCRADDILTVTAADGTTTPLKFCVLQTHIDAAEAAATGGGTVTP